MLEPVPLAPITVEVEGLTKSFMEDGRGEVRAVAGIDFVCREGEVFGLLGANGAGKTTTLRMLSTVLNPTAGKARVLGFDVETHGEEVRRSLGFHSASTALYPRLTARETLDFFARVNQVPSERVKPRVDRLIERFGIGEYADARVEKLSSGMKQKVAIARTLAHDPPVLIFDEPTVGLDVLNAMSLLEIVEELRSEGRTVIYSSHIMSEAERICDRIAVLHRGQILALGTLEELQDATGLHYLQDIFVKFVREAEAERQ
ncbi:MAG: ABC transporter ATP-binding protein [Gemmatimonadetes bacterium]|nr:ABC transporter ATP-binding protein [Gemmatimonadota bacterium]